MLIQPYEREVLQFAWCHRVYFRWRTWRRHEFPAVQDLTIDRLREILAPYKIHPLEFSSNTNDMRLLASLRPADSVSVAASKIKGRMNAEISLSSAGLNSTKSLARGYFAITVGKSTASAIESYLEKQGEHHGYAHRTLPPVFVRDFAITPEDERLLATDHAVTLLKFHLCLATWYRRGVFVPLAAEAVTERWRSLQPGFRYFLEKVSFVPDHVHLAVRVHPTVVPADLVVALMNASQELMWSRFDQYVISAGVDRLWQPSAYIGSFGDLTSNMVSQYVTRFDAA